MVDFDYYQSGYGGKVIQEADIFLQIEHTAMRWIDQFTFGRLTSMRTEENISDGICAICDAIYQNREAGGLVSENVDGYSVQYNNPKLSDEIYQIARLHLPSKYFYRGI